MAPRARHRRGGVLPALRPSAQGCGLFPRHLHQARLGPAETACCENRTAHLLSVTAPQESHIPAGKIGRMWQRKKILRGAGIAFLVLLVGAGAFTLYLDHRV